MQIKQHQLISPTPGTQRSLMSLHFGPQDGGRKVYIQASLHADELPGMLVAHYLRKHFERLEQEGKIAAQIVMVPVANPIGLSQALLHAQLGRFDLASGENFNRHYPAMFDAIRERVAPLLSTDGESNTRTIRQAMRDALASITPKNELASQRLTLMKLAFDADLVLDLHCDSEAALHLYCGTPLWPIVEPLARLMGSHATLLATESGDHPFDEACSQTWWQLRDYFRAVRPDCPIEHGCTAITVELRGELDVRHDLAQQDAARIVDYLTYRGDIIGTSPVLPDLIAQATPLAGSETLVAQHGGLLTFLVKTGQRVTAGTVIAQVIDTLANTTHDIRCTVDGMFYAHVRNRLAFSGMSIGKVAGTTAFKSGKLLSA
jgi:uncharacterized protein